MLKKISVQQVRIGMHLHSMEGAWIDHPFWKTRFVIREQGDVDKLRASGLPAVWIDVAKGVDVAEDAPRQPRPPRPLHCPSPSPHLHRWPRAACRRSWRKPQPSASGGR